MDIDRAVKYFNNVNPKYLRRFNEVTPEGNWIKGWICNKSNKFYGSLVIDSVNGEPVKQFVQSFPKIFYYEDTKDISLNKGEVLLSCHAYEKLDGSCLIIYPLLDEHENILEIVPKTRGRAVADKNFLGLYNKCEKSHIYDYYRRSKGILYFEMYGILNQHTIIHYDTGINLKLIGVYKDNKFYDVLGVNTISLLYGFDKPDCLFQLHPNGITITSKKYDWYFSKIPREELHMTSILDMISKIGELMEYLNKTYIDMYGRLAVEGVVLNTTDANGNQRYIKIKPPSIELKHRSEHGIPKSSITKECLKYFDEYGSRVDEIYQEDTNHHTEYIHRMLSEDYPVEMINKSAKKIEKVFMQIWDNQKVPVSIHNICDKLITENPGKDIKDLMRIFAVEYPMKKKDAHTIYTTLEYKLKKL